LNDCQQHTVLLAELRDLTELIFVYFMAVLHTSYLSAYMLMLKNMHVIKNVAHFKVP